MTSALPFTPAPEFYVFVAMLVALPAFVILAGRGLVDRQGPALATPAEASIRFPREEVKPMLEFMFSGPLVATIGVVATVAAAVVTVLVVRTR